MSEHHAFASLSPRLLARKGGAKPAMRRQDTSRFLSGGMPIQPEDLGWNDWGQEAGQADVPVQQQDVSQAAPVDLQDGEMPEVLRQIEQIAWRINRSVTPSQVTIPGGKRAAFTLRLDAQRHFRLKMAGVVLNRSAQVLVTEALDKYLSEIPEIAHLKPPAGKQG